MVASGSKITDMLIGAKNYKTYEDLRGATIGTSTQRWHTVRVGARSSSRASNTRAIIKL